MSNDVHEVEAHIQCKHCHSDLYTIYRVPVGGGVFTHKAEPPMPKNFDFKCPDCRRQLERK